MASPAEITKALPDTLPADFNEWDGGDHPATPPGNTNGAEVTPGSGDAAKLRSQPARLQIVPHSAENLHNTPPIAPAAVHDEEVPLRPLRSKSLADGDLISSPASESESFYEVDQALFRSFRSNTENQEDVGRTNRKKKTIVIASAGSIALLLVLIPLMRPSMFSMFSNAKSPATSQTAGMNTLSTANAPKPSPSTLMTAGTPITTDTPLSTDAEPATATEEETAPQVDSKMMRNQLNAPTRIPHDIKMQAGKEPPPASGIGAAGIEGLGGGGAIGNIFKGQSGPKVKAEAPRTVNISAGVAVGLLIQKSAPVYPPLARSAHISGTVVLQATISKTGVIEHLRVVSGPIMLQQAAVAAVRNWRYKPYMLDREPVEVETIVSVVFSMGR